MKIAKTLLAILLFNGATLFNSSNVQAQQTITIGTSAAVNSDLPAYFYNNFSWSQSVFLASEIGISGIISKIAYSVYSTGTYNFSNQKIYIYESTTSDFYLNSAYESPISKGATLVYSGPVSFTHGWNEIIFQTPFYYSGNNNLIICYEHRSGTLGSFPYFYTTSVSDYQSKAYAHNTESEAFGTSGYTQNFRNNIKLTIEQSSNDLTISEWTFPTSGTTGSNAMPIVLKVQNVGSAAQSGFLVKYSIDNGINWESKTYSSSVAAGGSASVSFIANQTADMSALGKYRCIAVVRSTGDTMTNNDTLRKDIIICGGGYAGTYTIGRDTASDFSSIHSAIETIESCGIIGPVNFKIKSGLYTEQIKVGPIYGVTASTPITFESFTGNANDVVFQYANHTADDNYVVRIDTAAHITFKNMTFKTLGTTYSRVFEILHSNNCTLENNQIIGYNGGTSTLNQDNIYIFSRGSYISNNILIKNNTIKYGAMGIYTSGDSYVLNRVYSITLEGNNISDYGNTGIYTNYTDSLIIKQNNIKCLRGSTQPMYINYCNGIKEISRNRLHSYQGITMQLFLSSGGVGSPAIIANNFIHQSSGNNQTVYIYDSNYLNFIYNSIHTIAIDPLSKGLYVQSGTNITLKNNNIINRGGYSIYNNGTNNIIASDYNNYFTTGTYFAYWNGNQNYLSVLRSTSGMEAHSINTNVAFYSDDDLHAVGLSLDGKGTPVAGVTEDYDGQTRDATTPDIGADEYELMANDAAIVSFENLGNICPGSATTIQAKIKNYGTLSLTSIKVGWSVNGLVQTPINLSPIISPLNEAIVTIGNYNFNGSTTYEIKAWIDSLNGGLDGNPYNDTLISSSFRTAFATGTYSIGPSLSADFYSLDDAILVLNQYGICGSVVFELESGTYTGQYLLRSISGSSNNNTITFQSQSGDSADVILQFNPSSATYAYIFKLDSTNHIKFKNLTFNNQSTIYTGSITLANSTDIEVEGSNFKAIENALYNSYNYHIYIVNSHRVKVSHNSFNNNPGAVYSAGNHYPNNNKNIDVISNSIYNFTQYGVYGYFTGDSSEVIGNTIRDASNGILISGIIGINFTFGDGNLKIANNDIRLTANNVGFGIRIHNQNYYNFNASIANTVTNNFIYINTGTNYNTYGITLVNAYYTDLYYNTVRLDNCGSGSYALNDNYSDQLEIKNNNFDAGDKVVMYVYNPTGLIYSDYNNFSSSTIYPIFHSGYRTFASYQTYTGNDSHSLSVAPYYVSQNSYQLHDIHLNNAGSPISGITTDIEGDTRSTSTPDIGADEYTILANDAKLYAINEPDNIVVEGNVPIKLSLQNMGATSIYLITLKYQIDTGTVYAYNWSGSLAPLAIDSLILVDSANLTSGTHSIKAWTMNPNNINDLNKNNDTLSKTFQVQIIPRIIVEPSSVYETIAACDDSITVNLKVKNEGIATLTVNTVGRQANRNTTLEVLLLTYGTSSFYYTNLVNALDETFTDYNLVYSTASTVAQLQSDLVGKDVVILPYMNSISDLAIYQSFTNTFQNFVSNGGSFIFAGQFDIRFAYITNTGLWNNTTYNNYTSSSTLTVNSHPITNGMLGSDFTSINDQFYYHTGTPPNYTNLLKYGSYEVAGMSNYGDGMVFYLGYRYFNSNQTIIEELASNTLAYIAAINTDWIYSNDTAFTVLPGDSITIPITMNSTGLTNGTYTKSLTLTSNSPINPLVHIPCTLTVLNQMLNVNLGPDTLTCAGNSITLSSTGNFTSYLWSDSSSQPILVVDSTGTGIGSKQIVLQVTNNLNCTGSDTIMVSFYDCTSLNNVDNNLFTMRVYPNPSKGEFVIESNATEVKTMQMSIMDAQGRLVITKKISNQGGTFYEHIDLSTQPKGAYFIKLSNNDAEKIFQVLIQ